MLTTILTGLGLALAVSAAFLAPLFWKVISGIVVNMIVFCIVTPFKWTIEAIHNSFHKEKK